MSLAAIIITKNEEHNIERCLQSVTFCDEIVVVDSESTDQTVHLAKKFTPNVHVLHWSGFAQQRNRSLMYTDCDWILSLDADEEITEELRAEIKKGIERADQQGVSAFYIPRKTYHSGKWIRHGGWYPNYLIRVFRKASGVWEGDEVHEYWKTSLKTEKLRHPIVHHSFRSIQDQVSRNNLYSSLLAQRKFNSGRRFSPIRLVVKPFGKFIETYFLKLGLLDGYLGFVIAVSASYSVFLQWAKIWELERREKEKN